MSARLPDSPAALAVPPGDGAEGAASGARESPPANGGGEPGEAAWQALALRVSAERRRLAEGEAIDLGGALGVLRDLLEAGPSAAVAGPAGLALRDELEQLVRALEGAVEASGRELVELDRQRRALGAYLARAGRSR